MFSRLFAPRGDCYMIGIGGVSMSALACLLQERGIRVRGSDAQEGESTRMLRSRGIAVQIGESEEITEQTVVYTGAVDRSHPQMRAAIGAGKRLLSRAQLLGAIAEEYPHVLSVAGCHGKTTACSMLAHILRAARRPFCCHIGGYDLSLGNYFSTGDECFLTEACEFQRSFLSLKSEIAVILNIDRDHTDCYRSDGELFEAYRTFAGQAGRVVVNADDTRARNIAHELSFGLRAGEIRAACIRSDRERYAFTIIERGIPMLRVRLRVASRVNIYNALAAYAAGRLLGLTAREIGCGLRSFRGVKRRFEYVGKLFGAAVICDYAHHPREIEATLSTAERLCDGTVHVVFQPHTYSRTRDLMEEFKAVLRRAETPVLYRTYAAREAFSWDGSAVLLASRIPDAVYVQSPAQLYARLASLVRRGDLVLVLGAGDLYEIVKGILEKKTGLQ